MNYSKKIMEECFFILKFLKQRNDFEREIDDIVYEEECYYNDSYNYLI